MKLRAVSLMLCLVMLSSLLSGCNNAVTDNSEPSAESSVSDVQEESHTPEGPIPEEKADFFTENGQRLLPEASDIPSYCTETDVKYLYQCQLAMPDAEGFSVCAANDIVLLFYMTDNGQYCDIMSLESGSLINTIPVEYDCQWGQFEDGSFWIVNCQTLEVRFYDTGGRETVAREGEDPGELRDAFGVYVSSDRQYLITTHYDGDPIEIRGIDNGEYIIPDVPSNMQISDISETSKGIYFDGGDGMGYLYNLTSKQSEIYSNDIETGYFYGDLFDCMTDEYIKLGDLSGERFIYTFMENNGYIQDLDYGCLAFSYNVESILTFCDLREGRSVSLTRDEYVYGHFVTLLENGSALIMEYSENGTSVFIYDLTSALRDDEVTEDIEVLCVSDDELEIKTQETAELIYNTHGVEIIYGSEGNDFDIYDYVGVAVLDLYEIYNALNTTCEILSQFPEGMLRETYSETDKGLRLYLCGNIYGVQSGGVDMAGGVTTEIDGYIAVVLDIHDNLWYNIPHEFSHVFDNRIAKMSDPEGTDWFALWESATPISNAYTYSYDDYYNNFEYTISEGCDDPEKVWFVDGYGRTFPTEDRARLFEYMLIPETNSAYIDIYDYENLVYKAKLYSYILRQCFPSCNTEEANAWERNLGVIDASVIPETEAVG